MELMNNNQIPEEAIEPAAKAIHEAGGWCWSERTVSQDVCARNEALAALEAAAPFLVAKALESAAEAIASDDDPKDALTIGWMRKRAAVLRG